MALNPTALYDWIKYFHPVYNMLTIKCFFVWRHLLKKLDSDQLQNIKFNDLEQIKVSSGGNWIFNDTILIFEQTRYLSTGVGYVQMPSCTAFGGSIMQVWVSVSPKLCAILLPCIFGLGSISKPFVKKPWNVLSDFLIKH